MLKNRDFRLRFATAVVEALIEDQATDPDAIPLPLDRYLSGGESEGALIRRLVRYELPAEPPLTEEVQTAPTQRVIVRTLGA